MNNIFVKRNLFIFYTQTNFNSLIKNLQSLKTSEIMTIYITIEIN